LPELGGEEDGYGLYSYAMILSDSSRSSAFLTEIFKSIPSIEDNDANRRQLNIFYIPLLKDKLNDFTAAVGSSGNDSKKLGADYTRSFYDYRMARAILNRICNMPSESMRGLCDGDLSRGPLSSPTRAQRASWSLSPTPSFRRPQRRS